MKWISTIFLFYSFTLSLSAQQLYPDLTGQALIDQLRADYKPAFVLSYDTARDTMFARIDNVNGNVTGVYSGYTIPINPAADPSTDAYNQDMNTEHSWPQSMGADVGNAHSDLHHLFPVRMQVNSSRGNDPYGEIPDATTDTWWRLNYSQSTIPTSNIEEYSEKAGSGLFEPREDHKGNAARAIFYFYTMYKEQSDTNFFNTQKDDLRSWNLQDAVDQKELDRSQLIATYQDNKQNPFVLDTSLVRRAYFMGGSSSGGGDTTVTGQPGEIHITEIMQNPSAVADVDGEWFEIYNSTDHAINIDGWFIRDNDTNSHQINAGGSLIISPDSYLVLGRNANSATNGGVNIDYQYSGIDLANSADEVVLFAADGVTEMDRVEYDGGPTWPDPTGASMYLNSVQNGNNDPLNWSTSLLTWAGGFGDFGSPGYSDVAAGIGSQFIQVPRSFDLANFPNPFNPQTTIRYRLAKAGFIKLAVFNTLGQEIRVLLAQIQQAGIQQLKFDGRDLPSGIYYLRLSDRTGKSETRKMILMK